MVQDPLSLRYFAVRNHFVTFNNLLIIYLLSALWNLDEYCRQKQLDFRERGMIGRRELQALGTKRRRLSGDVTQVRCIFLRNLYPHDDDLPKTR